MYIRTKDRIVKVETIADIQTKVIFKDNFVAQSENLEELCDEFVIEYVASDVLVQVRYAEFQWAKEDFESNKKGTLYGAIRVAGKGLIYVAKMNDKGELELI